MRGKNLHLQPLESSNKKKKKNQKKKWQTKERDAITHSILNCLVIMCFCFNRNFSSEWNKRNIEAKKMARHNGMSSNWEGRCRKEKRTRKRLRISSLALILCNYEINVSVSGLLLVTIHMRIIENINAYIAFHNGALCSLVSCGLHIS